ncbi:MAG: DUF2806 domain-containing protein [Alphaproteobacteria bacterium]|nr:DUF2806 domain-containing protein [Alphaproteobacteria bacterium]
MQNIPTSIQSLATATLGKVADKFVDFVITKHTGVSRKVFEAQGDIEADKVKTKWELLEKPFWLQAEAMKMGREYNNFGNMLLKSSPLITSSENKIADDNDVFWGLLEHSKTISNDDVQDLISKIIAGEYNNPETYSMSTLQTLKMLGKNEIELFERFGTLLVNNTQIPASLFTGRGNVKNIMSELKLDFGQLQTMQSLGLILPNEMKIITPNPTRTKLNISYFDKIMTYEVVNENTDIIISDFYNLSISGEQIVKHLKPKYNETYFAWLKKNYSVPNYTLKK